MEYPPPFDEHELIAKPTDPEDERIEVGVAIVGGGPAGLACANKLLDLLADEPEADGEARRGAGRRDREGQGLRRAHAQRREHGAGADAGAVPGPRSGQRRLDAFAYQEVTKDAVYLLTKKAALPLVPMPPNFRNHGNYGISVSKLSRFLAEQAEEKGAYILTETVADKLLVEDRIVRGIRSGDRGRGKDG